MRVFVRKTAKQERQHFFVSGLAQEPGQAFEPPSAALHLCSGGAAGGSEACSWLSLPVPAPDHISSPAVRMKACCL